MSGRYRGRIVAATLAGLLAMAANARASIILNAFAPSAYNANTAQMDTALGINGFSIEDFEDTALLSMLSYQVVGSSSASFTSLPHTYEIAANTFTLNANWDGTHVLLSNGTNLFAPALDGNEVDFYVAGGTTAFGIGLASFQSLASQPFPITDHILFVNGVNLGTLESLTGWSGGLDRNLYLRIDATGADVINSVSFVNAPASVVDLLVFDHLAIQGVQPPTSVPEPTTLVLLGAGVACVALGPWRRKGAAA
jgi:hypothetical protein